MERTKKLFMTTRYNFKWTKPEKKSCPIKEDYELIKVIEPISFNDDKTIKEYKEHEKYVVKKSKWHDFIKSFDIGSPSEQVLNHLTKGTPLITAHTLPEGDYRKDSLLKGAEIVRELQKQGLTLDSLIDLYNSQKIDSSESTNESEVAQ